MGESGPTGGKNSARTRNESTHFISCRIGYDNPDGLIGKLLAKRLAVKIDPPSFLDVDDAGTANAIRAQLQVGDLPAYASMALKYQHIAIIVEIPDASRAETSAPKIACHTHSHEKSPFTFVGWPKVQLIKIIR